MQDQRPSARHGGGAAEYPPQPPAPAHSSNNNSTASHAPPPTAANSSPYASQPGAVATRSSSPDYGLDHAHAASQPHHLRPTSAPRPVSGRPSPHARQPSGDAGAMAMPPPSATSPRPRSVTPTPASGYRPPDRALPARTVTPETLPDAFVEFILYCNPQFPLDVDTTALRQAFVTTMPKSEGKDFEVSRLFELIRQYNNKELESWNQVALHLGVDPPDSSKQQSDQKISQYMVRLKRWMVALHVMPFFEYLLGNPHPYFDNIPPPSDPYPAGGRAGVLPNADTALRALDPSFRPKRGRRRNSDLDPDENLSPGSKPPRYGDGLLGSAIPNSAVPSSAHPDNYHDPWAIASAVTPSSFAPWATTRAQAPTSAVTPAGPSRWTFNSHAATPSTPHPTTPHPLSARPESAFDEPKSAVTPSSSRKRKRNGPAVSSAWSSGPASGVKPRGRPPANRNVQDGPFGTFPADPANDKPSGSQPSSAVERVAGTTTIEIPSPRAAEPATMTPTPMSAASEGGGRPRLPSLQVPKHTGGPVVLVNGQRKESETRSDSDDPSRVMFATAAQTPQMLTPQSGLTMHSAHMGPPAAGGSGAGVSMQTPQMLTPQSGFAVHTPQIPTPQSVHSADGRLQHHQAQYHQHQKPGMPPTASTPHTGISATSATSFTTGSVWPPATAAPPGVAFETLKRLVASDLLRATLSGRTEPLSRDESKSLAEAILDRMTVPRADATAARPQDDAARFTAAIWLGVGPRLGPRFDVAPKLHVAGGKRLRCTRYRVDAQGYEEVVPAAEPAGAPGKAPAGRVAWDLGWSVSLGACVGNFELTNLVMAEGKEGGAGEDEYDWDEAEEEEEEADAEGEEEEDDAAAAAERPPQRRRTDAPWDPHHLLHQPRPLRRSTRRKKQPSRLDVHDRIWEKARAASRNLEAPGWVEAALAEVARRSQAQQVRAVQRAAAAAGVGAGAAGPEAQVRQLLQEQIDWKTKYEMLLFAGNLAKGALEREKEAVVQRVTDALMGV